MLELVLALGLLIAAGLTVLGSLDRGVGAILRVREQVAAEDLAWSTMAQIEAGVAAPLTLSGPEPAWSQRPDAWEGDPLVPGGAPEQPVEDDEPAVTLIRSVETEPSDVEGLTRVIVRVFASEAGLGGGPAGEAQGGSGGGASPIVEIVREMVLPTVDEPPAGGGGGARDRSVVGGGGR